MFLTSSKLVVSIYRASQCKSYASCAIGSKKSNTLYGAFSFKVFFHI